MTGLEQAWALPMSALWHAVRGTCARVSQCALDFVYPPVCAFCEIPTGGDDQAFRGSPSPLPLFCSRCQTALAVPVAQRCRRCSAPLGPGIPADRDCLHCRHERYAFERVWSLGVYRDNLAAACLRIKRGGTEPLALGLAALLWDQSGPQLAAAGIDVVIPVPHHWTERAVRAHLPPETLSRMLARRLKAPVAGHILRKARRTPAQATLSPRQRRQNLQRAFRIAGGARLAGLTILLVDDVLTTGTTAHRATLALRDAGAARVVVAVIARGLGD